MNKFWKIAIVVALVAAVAAVVAIKQTGPKPATDKAAPGQGAMAPAAHPVASLPRLVDLGSTMCIPCKMMAPILEDLKKEYDGQLQVEFIDVMANPDAATPYKISLIPTQVFFDASGQERFRHEGFFSKEDILAKWKELGIDLGAGSATAAPAFERRAPASPTGGSP